jgi:Matrixin
MKLKLLLSGCVAGAVFLLGNHVMATANDDDPVFSPVLAAMNARLRGAGVTNVAIGKAELLVHANGAGHAATTIFANDRTHLLDDQFVENDPRRGGSSNISYLVDQSDGNALGFNPAGGVILVPNAVTEAQLDLSVAAWTGPNCNGPGFVKVADTGADPDLVDAILLGNFALLGTPFADVTHGGWLPPAFHDLIAPNGGDFILAVTFTFIFIDDDGNPTDDDRDGRADAAFREIFYNLAFAWGTGVGNPNNVDIQSVAIHEFGHGLGLAHFGKLFLKNNGTLQFAPKAIMNAAYTGPDRQIRGTDNAAFCHIWANSH